MKKNAILNVMRISAASILLIIGCTTASNSQTHAFKGKVIDSETGKTLEYAAVAVEGTNIGTVTNNEGAFTLKIGDQHFENILVASYIGYMNSKVAINNMSKSKLNIIKLTKKTVTLNEITATPKNPRDIVKAILRNIDNKYNTTPTILKSFYRESIHTKNNYQTLAEAVVSIYKAPYISPFKTDQVHIEKGRKNINHDKIDTLLVKLRGGPRELLYLDLIKNPSVILNYDFLKFYTFELSDVVIIDNRMHYVIDFKQTDNVNYPLYDGKLYIDVENLALKEATFSMNMVNDLETQRLFLHKKPISMAFTPLEATYHIKYQLHNNQLYFNYARGFVSFKCGYRRKIFKRKYTIKSEMVITDRITKGAQPFPRHDRFYASDVLTEKISDFADTNFWGQNNIIDPNKDINKAIENILKEAKTTESK